MTPKEVDGVLCIMSADKQILETAEFWETHSLAGY